MANLRNVVVGSARQGVEEHEVLKVTDLPPRASAQPESTSAGALLGGLDGQPGRKQAPSVEGGRESWTALHAPRHAAGGGRGCCGLTSLDAQRSMSCMWWKSLSGLCTGATHAGTRAVARKGSPQGRGLSGFRVEGLGFRVGSCEAAHRQACVAHAGKAGWGGEGRHSHGAGWLTWMVEVKACMCGGRVARMALWSCLRCLEPCNHHPQPHKRQEATWANESSRRARGAGPARAARGMQHRCIPFPWLLGPPSCVLGWRTRGEMLRWSRNPTSKLNK